MRFWGKFTASLLAVLLMGGCAFEKSDSDPNRQRDLNNREKLLNAYKSIQGVYEGTFDTPSRMEEVRLTLSYTEVVVGKNEDGEIRYQPELRARFTRLSRDILDTYMAASYIEERPEGNLTLTTEENGGEDLYIRGTIAGDSFTAPVLSKGNILGQISVSLKTRDVVAPGEGTDSETYDRIKARLSPYVGQYIADVVPQKKGSKNFKMEILIRLEDVNVNGTTLPVLASYSRDTEAIFTVHRHSITFDSSRTPPRLTFSPDPGGRGLQNWTLTAPWVDGKFEGDAIFPVYPAKLKARRVSAPDNARPAQRLQPGVIEI